MSSQHRASEIKRERVLANFRTPLWKQKKKPNWRDQRPGMDPKHLANIRKLPCVLCPERKLVQAHHLRFGPAIKERGVGYKATDRWALPICIAHHEMIHQYGSRREQDWWDKHGIDAVELCKAFWSKRNDFDGMVRVLLAHQLAAMAQLGRTSQPF